MAQQPINWKTYAPYALAVLIMLAAGWKQGVWSERWYNSPDLDKFAIQLAEVPLEFGEWKGVDGEKSSEAVKKISGAAGEVVRVYRNAANEEVRISLICGRMQDVFYHTPDRCYVAAGFVMQGEQQRSSFETAGAPAEFFTATFEKTEATGSHAERGFWSFMGDGKWDAPENYKLRFSGEKSALYKLYVFSAAQTARRSTDRDYCKDFIEQFIPVLDRALRPVLVETGRVSDEPANKPADAQS